MGYIGVITHLLTSWDILVSKLLELLDTQVFSGSGVNVGPTVGQISYEKNKHLISVVYLGRMNL